MAGDKQLLIEKAKTPLDYIECLIAFSPKDFSSDNRSASLYAVVFGWDNYEEFKRKFGWSDFYITQLKHHHEIWEQTKTLLNISQDNNTPMNIVDAAVTLNLLISNINPKFVDNYRANAALITARNILFHLYSNKAKWIKCKTANYNWCCSKCGYGYTDHKLSYCYDCGAKMSDK